MEAIFYYSESNLQELKYPEIFGIAKSLNIPKPRSKKKVYLIKKILEAQKQNKGGTGNPSESESEEVFNNVIPTSPSTSMASRKETFITSNKGLNMTHDDLPTTSSGRSSRRGTFTKTNITKDDKIQNELTPNSVRSSRRGTFTTTKEINNTTGNETPGRSSRRGTFTRNNSGKSPNSTKSPLDVAFVIPEIRITRPSCLSPNVMGSSRRETFTKQPDDNSHLENKENKTPERRLSRRISSVTKKTSGQSPQTPGTPMTQSRGLANKTITPAPQTPKTEEPKMAMRTPKVSKGIDHLPLYVNTPEPKDVTKMTVFERLNANVTFSAPRSSAAHKEKHSLRNARLSRTPGPKMVHSSRTPITESVLETKKAMSTKGTMTPKEKKQYLQEVRAMKMNKTIHAEPSTSRTPFSSAKKLPLLKKTPQSEQPVARKAPNFAEIHQRQFGKMENIKDMKIKQINRAISLLSPPPLAKSSQRYSGMFTVNLNKTGITPKKDVKRSLIPVLAVKPRLQTAKETISTKSHDSKIESMRDKNRAILKGVRMNRRFQLQLKNLQK